MKKSYKSNFWFAFNITAVIFIGMFIFVTTLLYAYTEYAQTVDVHASVVQTTPEDESAQSILVGIRNPKHTPLNAIEFELHFDPSILYISAIVPHETLCEERFLISNSIDNVAGVAFFQCGTIVPYTGATGTVATILAHPLISATSSISFGEKTHVLSHDGFGTDATREAAPLTFATF